jgi:hypothetical protein
MSDGMTNDEIRMTSQIRMWEGRNDETGSRAMGNDGGLLVVDGCGWWVMVVAEWR